MRSLRNIIAAATMGAVLGGLALTGTAAAAPPAAPREASRSVQVWVQNYMPHTLVQSSYLVLHGINTAAPPAQINPFTVATWRTESHGVATGTEGTANFWTPVGNVFIWWNNPFLGSSTYECWVPSNFTCTNNGSNSLNTNVTFQILPRLG